MRLLVLSDSHGREVMLERAARFAQREGIGRVVHLGDITGDAERLKGILSCELISVRGNCDFFSAVPEEQVVTLEGIRIFLTHGHRYGVKTTLDALSYRAEELMCTLALFGHTHEAFTGMVGRTILVNPGALQLGSACVLTLEKGRADPRIVTV